MAEKYEYFQHPQYFVKEIDDGQESSDFCNCNIPRISHLIRKVYGFIGGFIANFAVWVIFTVLLVTLVLAPGMTRLTRFATDGLMLEPKKSADIYYDYDAKIKFDGMAKFCTKTSTEPVCQMGVNDQDLLDTSCPHLKVLLLLREDLSYSDPKVTEALFELDMQITFAIYSITFLQPAFFYSNVSEWMKCQRRKSDDGCEQFSYLSVSFQ